MQRVWHRLLDAQSAPLIMKVDLTLDDGDLALVGVEAAVCLRSR